MAERSLIGRGLLPAYGRVANYQRVRTSQAMDTLTEYTCLGISPAIPRVGGKPDHVSSQGKEAVFVTHDIQTEGSKPAVADTLPDNEGQEANNQGDDGKTLKSTDKKPVQKHSNRASSGS